MSTGATTTVDVQLTKLATTDVSVQVVMAGSTTPIENAQVALLGPDGYRFEGTSDATGEVAIDDVFELSYDVVGAQWGYRYALLEGQSVDGSTGTITIELEEGYEDDFELDLGWTTVGSTLLGGSWDQDEPADFGDAGIWSPTADVADDIGTKCYLTGNDDINDFVYGGSVSLLSPKFDAAAYTEPVIDFSYWILNADILGNAGDDGVIVKLNTPGGTTVIDTLVGQDPPAPLWQEVSYNLVDYITPDAETRLIIEAAANGDFYVFDDLLEVAIDAFEVREGYVSGIDVPVAAQENLYPNPTGAETTIELSNPISGSATLTIYGLTGKRYADVAVTINDGLVRFDATELRSGVYLYDLTDNGARLATGKFAVSR